MHQPKDTDSLKEYKNKTHVYAVYKRPTSDLETHTDWKKKNGKIPHVNGNQKKARLAIFISDKTYFNFIIKNIIREKGGHYMMIKGPIQEEDITVVNIHAPNIGAPQYIR